MGRPIVELVEFGAKRLGQFEISKAPSNNGTVCVVSALTALRLDSVPRQRTPPGFTKRTRCRANASSNIWVEEGYGSFSGFSAWGIT